MATKTFCTRMITVVYSQYPKVGNSPNVDQQKNGQTVVYSYWVTTQEKQNR
jgi:hypothetical protein